MNHPANLDDIHILIQSDDYATASARIAEARAAGHKEALLSLFEAICVYETGNDVETLRLIAEFLASTKSIESIEKRPYALFTAAVCLENLGLLEQAYELLAKVPESYPDIQKERAHIAEGIKHRKQALLLYSGIRGS